MSPQQQGMSPQQQTDETPIISSSKLIDRAAAERRSLSDCPLKQSWSQAGQDDDRGKLRALMSTEKDAALAGDESSPLLNGSYCHGVRSPREAAESKPSEAREKFGGVKASGRLQHTVWGGACTPGGV